MREFEFNFHTNLNLKTKFANKTYSEIQENHSNGIVVCDFNDICVVLVRELAIYQQLFMLKRVFVLHATVYFVL